MFAAFRAGTIGKAEHDGLGPVGGRAAAKCHDQIGLRLTCHFRGCDHIASRHMRAHSVRYPGAFWPQRIAQFADLVGRPGKRAAGDDDHTARRR